MLEGSEVKKNLLTLMGGTAIAQCIPILCAPLLTRLFTPDEFGIYANFMAVAAFLIVFISGKYELAIILPKQNNEAINILSLSCLLALFFSIVLFFLFLLFAKPVSTLLRVDNLHNVMWLIPISAFFATIYSIFNEWCIRKKKFVTLSKNKISNTSGIAGSSLFFGLTKTTSGLIYGQLVGQFLSSSLAFYRVFKEDVHLLKHVSIRKMKYFSIKYLNFAKFYIPGQFINTLTGQLPILMLTYKFGIYEVGLFSLTERVLGVPLTFLGNSFKDVFKQRAAEEYRTTGNCLDIYKKTMYALLGLSIIPFVLLFIGAPFLFTWVFGSEWYEAGVYARILCLMYLINFLCLPTSWMFVIAEKQKLELIWQFIFSVLTVGPLIAGIMTGSVKETLIYFCIGRSIAYLIHIFLTYRIAKGSN